MINVKGSVLSALTRVASKGDIRQNLNAVHFDKAGFAVATDGHALMAIRIAPFSEPSFRVDVGVLEGQIRVFGKVSRMQIDFSITPTPDADFPQWRTAFPRTLSGEPAMYDSALVERIRDALRDATGLKLTSPLEILTNGSSAGMVITADPNIAVLVAPFRGRSESELTEASAAALGFLEARQLTPI